MIEVNQNEGYITEQFQPLRHISPSGGKVFFILRLVLDFQVRTVLTAVKSFAKTCDQCVYDIGCGEMPYQSLFKERGYVGVDTKDRNSFKYQSPSVLLFDGEKLPLSDGSVSHVLCTEVLEHVPNPEKFISEIQRVLKQGGTGLLTVPWAARYHYIPHDYFRFTPTALQRLFEQFESIRIEARGSDWAVIYHKLLAIVMRVIFSLKGRKWSFSRFHLCIWLIFSIFTALFMLLPTFILAHLFDYLRLNSADDPLGYSVYFTK